MTARDFSTTISVAQELRQVREGAERMRRLVGFGDITLTLNSATTDVIDPRVGAGSSIILWPTNANAAAEIGAGTIYTSAKTVGTGFTLTNANNANSRTFEYVIVGS